MPIAATGATCIALMLGKVEAARVARNLRRLAMNEFKPSTGARHRAVHVGDRPIRPDGVPKVTGAAGRHLGQDPACAPR